MLRILEVHRSTFYYRQAHAGKMPKQRPGRPPRGYSVDHADRRIPDEQIKEWLSEAIHGDGYAYGYVKLTYHLRREYQLVINKKKVYRLCKEMGILRPQRKLKPRRPRKIARNRVVTGPNQVFETDIKYGHIHGEDRFFFVQSLIDVYDRMIVDYHVGLSCTGRDAALTLHNAKRCRSHEDLTEAVVRTDNGPQFVSEYFGQTCQQLGLEHERIPCRTPNKNAHIESFHAILESECLAMYEFRTYEEAYKTVADFMKHYNERRIHSSLGYRTPKEMHEAFLSNTARLEPIAL